MNNDQNKKQQTVSNLNITLIFYKSVVCVALTRFQKTVGILQCRV